MVADEALVCFRGRGVGLPRISLPEPDPPSDDTETRESSCSLVYSASAHDSPKPCRGGFVEALRGGMLPQRRR